MHNELNIILIMITVVQSRYHELE